MKNELNVFDEKKMRTLWDEDQEKWFFSVVDVIAVLTDSDRPRKYWNDLKIKLQKEGSQLSEKIGQLKMKAADGNETVANCHGLKMTAPDGKMRLTDAFRVKQSGTIARNARLELEQKTGKQVISPLNAKKVILVDEKKNGKEK